MNILIALLCLCTSFCFANDTTLDLRIPVVDMRDFYDQEKREAFLDTLHKAMTEIGFFAVRNTGVDGNTLHEAYNEAQLFFKNDIQTKLSCQTTGTKGQRGFVQSECAKGNTIKDYKEYYHIGREGLVGQPPNIWPSNPAFKTSLVSLYNELDRYVVPLQQAIVAVINAHTEQKLSVDFFNDMTAQGDTLLRALYYPALSKNELEEMTQPLFWAVAHTDIDLLAILPYATARGLQVELNGVWLNVVVPEDAFVINVGDMLENITNGLFVSARHRVLAQDPDTERFSMVLFVHPVNDADLTPLACCIEQTGGVQRYAGGTRKEFLWERLLELGIAPGLLEEYAKTGHTERQIAYNRQSPQVVKMLRDRS